MVAVERESDITSSTDDIAAYSRAAFSRASSTPTLAPVATTTTTGNTTSANGSQCDSLLDLVQPQMKVLGQRWLAVLKDYALLSLPEGLWGSSL